MESISASDSYSKHKTLFMPFLSLFSRASFAKFFNEQES